MILLGKRCFTNHDDNRSLKRYYNRHGQLHRINGPAYSDHYYTRWCINGLLHRVDGPAYMTPSCKYWYAFGVLHRIDGPASIEPYKEEWYLNGKRHREDGPAITLLFDDTKKYYLNDVRHSFIWFKIKMFFIILARVMFCDVTTPKKIKIRSGEKS